MAASSSSTAMNVWNSNFSQELDIISDLRRSFPVIAVDTEFPGFRWCTPREASEEHRYSDLKMNVDNMNLIQLGITMFDEQGRRPSPCSSWQFNFSNFNPATSLSSPESIDLLRQNGMDFERNMRDGIPANSSLAVLFNQKLFRGADGLKWVTFHGLYDVAYIVKLATGGRPLPITLQSFLILAREMLGDYFDIKYIARFCDGLRGGEIRLAKMTELMAVEKEGTSHQAGHDSLLVGSVFQAMKQKYSVLFGDQANTSSYVGVLYGLERQSQASREMMLCNPTPPPHAPTYPSVNPGQFLSLPPFYHTPLAPQAPLPYHYFQTFQYQPPYN